MTNVIMATREQYLAEAKRRGLTHGTISARPGLFEKSLPMVGQIAGGLAGSRGGAVGTIGGATAGAMAGKAGQLFMRSQRGEQMTPQSIAGELGTEGAITGAAETAFPVAGRILKPFTDRVVKKAIRPGIEGALRFFTGITPENTGRVLERGPKEVLTRPMRSRERGVRIAEDFLGNAQEATKAVNTEWADTVTPIMKSSASVSARPIRDAANRIEREFVGAEGPVLDNVKNVFATLQGAAEDVRQITSKPRYSAQTRMVESPIVSASGQPIRHEVTERAITKNMPANRLSVDKAIRARQQLDDVIYSGKTQGLLTPRQTAALRELRGTISSTVHAEYPDIAGVDTKRHVLSEAMTVIEKFSPESVNNVSRLGKMIDAFEDIDPAVREALQKADNVIAQKTGKSLLGAIRDRSAAKAFEPTELRAVRTYLISAVMGLVGLGTSGPLGAGAGTALGLTLSSPRLAGETLKAAQSFGRGTKLFARKTAPVATAAAGRTLFQKKTDSDSP